MTALKRSELRITNYALRLLPWLIALLLTALNLIFIIRLGPNDDAYITYRVARNLAAGHGLVYNPGEAVLSITTPGYALLLAAASLFSQNFVLLATILNGLALLALGALVIHLSRPAGEANQQPYSWIPPIIAVSLALTFPLLSEALGMETPLYIAVLLATFAAYEQALRQPDQENRWLAWTALAAAAAFLLRPDGALAGLVLGLHWLLTRRRIPWRPLCLGLLLAAPWIGYAWLTYGSPLPNTLAAKATQALGEAQRWGPQLAAEMSDWATTNPIGAALAIAGLGLAFWQRRDDRLLLAAWAAAYILAHLLLDVRGYFWYYAPLGPVVALLAGDGIDLARWLRSPGSANKAGRLLPGIFTGLLLIAALQPAAAWAVHLAAEPLVRYREAAYQQTAGQLRDLCAGDDGEKLAVGMAEVGLIGYESDCPVVDFAGLLQPDVAHLEVAPDAKMAWVIKRYAPPLVVLVGGVNFPHHIADQDWFRQRYESVHIAGDEFVSVIYKRSLGPSTQRDLSVAWWRSPGEREPVTTTLYFDGPTIPDLTLHAFIPAGASLTVSGNGERLSSLTGSKAIWRDLRLPVDSPAPAGSLTLVFQGQAGDQTLALGWLDSNALPAVHYFAPMTDASQRPRPTIRLDAGQQISATLAAAVPGPQTLELFHRDWPGVALAVVVNGQEIGMVGGADGWRTERLALPPEIGPLVRLELRSRGDHYARVAHAALLPAPDTVKGHSW